MERFWYLSVADFQVVGSNHIISCACEMFQINRANSLESRPSIENISMSYSFSQNDICSKTLYKMESLSFSLSLSLSLCVCVCVCVSVCLSVLGYRYSGTGSEHQHINIL